MLKARLHGMVLITAGLAWAGSAQAADEAKAANAESHRFFEKYFSPRMDHGLNGEIEAAEKFANPTANPWTRDDATVARVERRAISSAKSAVKRYAIESLGLDAWSLPLVRNGATGLDALRTQSGGPRLTFGFSHMAPRAEVLFSTHAGRVTCSADVMGRVGVTVEAPVSTLRFGVAVDPRDHSGTFGLTTRF